MREEKLKNIKMKIVHDQYSREFMQVAKEKLEKANEAFQIRQGDRVFAREVDLI